MAELKRKIHKWLSPHDPSVDQKKALRQRCKKTGQWFLKKEIFASFKDGDIPFIWINGIPGCGKTVLSSWIIKDLQQSPSIRAPMLLYFYFNIDDVQRNSYDSALRSLLWQAAHYVEGGATAKELVWLYETCGFGRSQPSQSDMSQALQRILQATGGTRMFLEALDECDQGQQALLEWLLQVASQADGGSQIIITSREEPALEALFRELVPEGVIVPIQQSEMKADIRKYVRSRIHADPALARWRCEPQVQDQIKSHLMRKAQGMFRWAAFQLDDLATFTDPQQLEFVLNNFPPALDEMYARIVARLPPETLHYSMRLLQALMWSKQPLRMEEAIELLSVDMSVDGRFCIDVKDRRFDAEGIFRLASSLMTAVSVQRDCSGAGRNLDTTSEVCNTVGLRLIHHSAKDYLISSRGRLSQFSEELSESSAAAHLANVTLTYLLQIDGDSSVEEKSSLPLARYSAENWMHFAKRDEDLLASQNVRLLALQLLSMPMSFDSWLSIYDPDNRPSVDLKTGARCSPHPLYYASLGGLMNVALDLIDQSADINGRGGYYGNALQAACAKGHSPMAVLLLDRGADVNAQGGHYGNALQAACERGYESLAKVLLDRGADVNVPGGHFESALQAACERGHESLTRVLLDHGADVNARGQEQSDALQTACRTGNEQLVEMLLNYGADVNALEEVCGDDLMKTAYKRDDQSWVQRVLDRGADLSISAQPEVCNTSHRAAHGSGYEELTQMLLDKGAETVTISAAAAASSSSVVIGATAVGASGAIGAAIALFAKLFAVDIPMKHNDRDKANAEMQKAIESRSNAIKCQLEIELKLEEAKAAEVERGLRRRGDAMAAITKRCQSELMRIRQQQTELDDKIAAQQEQAAKHKKREQESKKREQSDLLARKDQELQNCYEDIALRDENLESLNEELLHLKKEVAELKEKQANTSRATGSNVRDEPDDKSFRSDNNGGTSIQHEYPCMPTWEHDAISRRQRYTFDLELVDMRTRNDRTAMKLADSRWDLHRLAQSHKRLRLWKLELQARCDQLGAQMYSSNHDVRSLTQSCRQLCLSNSELQVRCGELSARFDHTQNADDPSQASSNATMPARGEPCLSCRVSLSKIDMHLTQYEMDGWLEATPETAKHASEPDYTICGRCHDPLHRFAAILELAHMEYLPHMRKLQADLKKANEELREAQDRLVDVEEQLSICQILQSDIMVEDNDSPKAQKSDAVPTEHITDQAPRTSETTSERTLSIASESCSHTALDLDQGVKPAPDTLRHRQPEPDSPSGSSFTWNEQADGENFSMYKINKSSGTDDISTGDADPHH